MLSAAHAAIRNGAPMQPIPQSTPNNAVKEVERAAMWAAQLEARIDELEARVQRLEHERILLGISPAEQQL